MRPGETRALIQALRDENARLRALSMTMPQPRMAAARGGGVGGTVAAVRDDSSREVAAEAVEAVEAVEAWWIPSPRRGLDRRACKQATRRATLDGSRH